MRDFTRDLDAFIKESTTDQSLAAYEKVKHVWITKMLPEVIELTGELYALQIINKGLTNDKTTLEQQVIQLKAEAVQLKMMINNYRIASNATYGKPRLKDDE